MKSNENPRNSAPIDETENLGISIQINENHRKATTSAENLRASLKTQRECMQSNDKLGTSS